MGDSPQNPRADFMRPKPAFHGIGCVFPHPDCRPVKNDARNLPCHPTSRLSAKSPGSRFRIPSQNCHAARSGMFRQTGWILHQQAANTALLFFSISGALRQKHVFKFIVSQISGKIGKRCRNRRPQRNSALIFYLVTEQGGWNPRILCLEWDKRVERLSALP